MMLSSLPSASLDAALPRPYTDQQPHREQENRMSTDTPHRSRLTTEGMGRAPNRAMLRAVGFLDDDFSRPMIGVASLFSDITPCNAHLDRLVRVAREGIRA